MVRRIGTADDLLAQAKANSHNRGKRKGQDRVLDRDKHVEKTKKDQTGQYRSINEFCISICSLCRDVSTTTNCAMSLSLFLRISSSTAFE